MAYEMNTYYSERPEEMYKALEKNIKDIQTHHNNLIEKYNAKTGKPIKLEKLYFDHRDIDYYPRDKDYCHEYTWREKVNAFKIYIAEQYNICKDIHEQNLPKIEENKKSKQAIIDFMLNAGIPKEFVTYSYTSPATGRATNKKHKHTQRAGFLSDIEKVFSIEDGFSYIESAYKRALEQAKEYEEKHLMEEKKKQEEEKKTQDYKSRYALVIKFNVLAESDFETIDECYKALSSNSIDMKRIPENVLFDIISNYNSTSKYVKCDSELSFLNDTREKFCLEFPSFLFEEVSDDLSGEWRWGTEHTLTIKSEYSGKKYCCTYRTQPEHGISDCNSNITWFPVETE